MIVMGILAGLMILIYLIIWVAMATDDNADAALLGFIGAITILLSSVAVIAYYEDTHQAGLIDAELAEWKIDPKTGDAEVEYIKKQCKH